MKNYNISKIIRYQFAFIFFIAIFILGIVLSINTGTVDISPRRIFEIILLKTEVGTMESDIIWKIRLPRILTASILGGALSVSGFLLQTFFRNPIAGPFVLGISSGAKMFVSFVLIVMINHFDSVPSYVLVLAAFVGAMVSMGFVMLADRKVNSMAMLLVVGIMIGYICSAITDFFITFAMESDIANLTAWSMGSFSGANWGNVKTISIIIFPTLIGIFMISKPMEAYQLGEGYAKSMGINIKLYRLLLIVFSSILSATVIAFAGPISFVGIAVPHLTKFIMNTAKPIIIIPATFLCGGVFCTFCDLIARTAFSPTELAIGTVTSVFGAPVVIWIMLKKNMRRA